ncbi:MAG TPA: DNA polymerase I [Blastocatellia bacterium]|nr:DNA polymerase I [Blastocatellia bacterium]
MSGKKRLFLVDGMSNIFRAYYAIRGLANSRGQPTNSVYGFTMTLRRLITIHKPDYIGVVLDSKEKTFRHEAYEHYKANRTEMPEDLSLQMPYILRVCEALRVPILRLPRYEADDIIGTLANKAVKEGLQAVIVTSDKDLCQLVRDSEIVILREDRAGEVWYDEEGVKKRLGVPPAQVVDLLGLMGDSSDNIPGAPGIGEKGAVQIIEQFGSIEAALAGWEEVKKRTYRESLRDHAEQIRQSRELARIETNVPVELDLEALVLEEPDHKLAYQLFSELEFQTLTREFADAAKSAEPGPLFGTGATDFKVTAQYRRIAAVEQLRKLASSLLAKDRFAFALADAPPAVAEPDPRPRMVGVAFSTARGNADYFDLENCDDRAGAIEVLKDVFDNGLIEKAVHDLKRAISLASDLGIHIENVTDDTLLQAYLLDPEASKYELPMLARQYLGSEVEPSDDIAHRASAEADLTGQLADVLNARIDGEQLDLIYRNIELPLVPILFAIERAGFRVDTKVLAELSVEMDKELEKLTGKIYALAGQEFNINSPSQLGDIFEKLNFEVSRKTSTGKISTSRDILDELALKYELPRLVIEYRELAKLKGTYVDAFPQLISKRDGRIHTTLTQTVAATGRLSSINPNLQNIPIRTELGRRIRRAFIPADGCVLLSADYSQIELRLLAHITRDEVMLEAFSKGEDIHARTAREVFGAKTGAALKEKRRVAKIVNFAIAYVIGPFGLAQRVGISRAEAKKVIEDYYRTYTGVKKFMDETPDKVRAENGVVRSIFGRLRRIADISNKNGNLRARAEREAINMPMQGTAADIVKMAMLRVDEALRREKLSARMILQVHDELVFEVPKKEVERASEVVKAAMESAAKLDVPLVVEMGTGKNWMDAKP